MNNDLVSKISKEIKISEKQTVSVITLLDEGNTIPFIARYRKEMTGNLDEETINLIHKEWEYAVNLQNRKDDVTRLIDEKGLLTNELRKEIQAAQKLVEVEDIYRPFKEKKKTKATEAIAKGLEPFANWILLFTDFSVREEAKKYLNEKVLAVDEAIEGAQYIIAERISDDASYRKYLRRGVENTGVIVTKAKKGHTDEKKVYEMYYEYQESVKRIPPHRILAINRASNEKVISASVSVEKDELIRYLNRQVLKALDSPSTPVVIEAIEDSYKRLIFPSIEREVWSDLFEKGENQAIEIFGMNLQKLLLQPPMKGKTILGIDPAFRTGCKFSVVNPNGNVLEKGVIYPHEKSIGSIVDPALLNKSKRTILDVINRHHVELIAIGNGTASRETENFIASLLTEFNLSTKYVIVNEAGASVYSASEVAREEFPDYSVEERSAASIARRLQDPLSELVKIDPKSIGVGQYQHDVQPKKLNESLGFVVTQAVNSVGVNANTASKSLLIYISGLNKSTAENIITYRTRIGGFKNRKQLNAVPKLGPKAYQQAIGFLRINDGDEVLDKTSIHPESYEVAHKIMFELGITDNMIGKDEIKSIVDSCDKNALLVKFKTDIYTLNDILDSLITPLRDPRDEYPQPLLKSSILKIEDLRPGMQLEGTVRNVVDFGAFVDIGLKNDGLVHISKMSKTFIKHPSDVLKVGDIVTVYINEVNIEKGKVSLSLIKPQ